MSPGLPIARYLAAMILAIVAWAAPSAAGAHEGHGHGAAAHTGHHRAASLLDDPPPVSVVQAETTALMRSSIVASPHATQSAASAVVVRPADSDGWDGRGLRGLCCCGAACCAPGILAASVVLPGPTPGHAVLRAYDAQARAGLGPEALTEPPRTIA